MKKQKNLAAALQGCRRCTLRETAYRSSQLRHLKTLTSSEGALNGANRYSVPEMSSALYLADAPDQAIRESTRAYRNDFGANAVIPAYAIFPVEVDLQNVLDLFDDSVLEAIECNLMELSGDWRAAYRKYEIDGRTRVVTQELGRAAFESGFEAIKYPSAYDTDRWNLVVFTENLSIPVRPMLPDQVLQAIIHLNTPPV